ncbi:MAG: class I SAM-dependent methyltransferase [Desulfobulbaceae bacterium]|jgi:SAM-dependent methyltransferase|nr:class I SAM-dependent methyltransferase [Desulfobulbaceae bacterium]
MNRLGSYHHIWGANWCTGRFLLPQLARLGREPGLVALDLACGESPFRAYFPTLKRYVRLDRFSRDKEVIIADMVNIPIRPASVDIVLLFQAISDCPDVITVLTEARRLLRPGGRLILFESMDYPEHDMPHDYYRLMPAGLRWAANKADLRLRELVYLGGLGTRCATLWNTLFMGKILSLPLIGFLGRFGIISGNIFCYCLDRIMPHPRLAANYLAVLLHDRDEEI